MGFIQLEGLQDIQEKQLLAEGRYPLLVESAQIRTNEQSGKTNILVVLTADNQPDTQNVLFNLALPHDQDEPSSRYFKLLQIKRFCTQFGINFDDGLNTEAFSGCRASANLTIKEYEGRKSNNLVLDPLPVE